MRVVVCDPGVSNVRSVVRAATHAATQVNARASLAVTHAPSDVRGADIVIVPGQGSFGAFARAIDGDLADALREHIARDKPYLGICLGLQVLFESSEEAPSARGLGVLAGHVTRLAPGVDEATGAPYALPHIGWNTVEPGGRHFYFAHSFAAAPTDASLAVGTTEYGRLRFASMIARDHVLGVQFHPEKSQDDGLALMADFFTRFTR